MSLDKRDKRRTSTDTHSFIQYLKTVTCCLPISDMAKNSISLSLYWMKTCVLYLNLVRNSRWMHLPSNLPMSRARSRNLRFSSRLAVVFVQKIILPSMVWLILEVWLYLFEALPSLVALTPNTNYLLCLVRITGIFRGIHRWPKDSYRKGPVKIQQRFHVMTSHGNPLHMYYTWYDWWNGVLRPFTLQTRIRHFVPVKVFCTKKMDSIPTIIGDYFENIFGTKSYAWCIISPANLLFV